METTGFKDRKKVLVLAQTPPPHHGQAIMQQYLVDAEWSWCNKQHIPLNYSSSIQQVGSFRFSKIAKLLGVLQKVRRVKKQSCIELFYYPPAGPNRIPLYRDVVTLLYARRSAKKIVLHFHAGGLSNLVERLNLVEKYFVKKAFRNIDYAVVLLPWLQKEVDWFAPKKVLVIPNGIEDVSAGALFPHRTTAPNNNILFVGNLKEEKGIFVLLAAAAKLKAKGLCFRVRVMGEAHSDDVRNRIIAFLHENEIADNVILLGSLTGEKKWEEFKQASVFCLPTYATEAMPVSILEAMMFSLPVVSTHWRAIPDMITNGCEGLLTPVKNEEALGDAIATLLRDKDLAMQMGRNGRKKFESHYHIQKHLSAMEAAFRQVVDSSR